MEHSKLIGRVMYIMGRAGISHSTVEVLEIRRHEGLPYARVKDLDYPLVYSCHINRLHHTKEERDQAIKQAQEMEKTSFMEKFNTPELLLRKLYDELVFSDVLADGRLKAVGELIKLFFDVDVEEVSND